MKKIISVLLCLALVAGIVTIGVSAENKPDLSFAVASDLHYNRPSEELEKTNDDPIFWYANRRCAMDDESGFILDEFLNQCAENDDCQFILIPGDMADDGRTRPEDHRDVAEKFRAFEQKTGKQIYVINGNHDASPDSNTTYTLFKEIYHEFGYAEALSLREDDCSYTADLGAKYRLIALDSNNPNASTEDGMTTDKIEWVHEQTKLAKADGRYPILMMHHNLLDHMPLQRIISRNFIVRFHYTTAELFADWGIKFVLSGHEHCSDAASFTSALGNKISDFATTALSMYPLQYRMFYFTDEEIKYEAKTIEKIDYNALTSTVKGYTDEMINCMKSGLNEYARNFLKVGVAYRLKLQFAKTDVPRDKFYGQVVMKALDRLDEILELPIKGENGLQALALQYGIIIPDSDYKNGWDIVGEAMAAHYEGSENYKLDSALVTSILRTVVLILRNDIAVVSDEMLIKWANDALESSGFTPIADNITKLCVQIFGTYTHIEYFFMAILSPFVYSFTCDDNDIDDNNGTIEGYGTASFESNINNIAANLNNIIAKVKLFTEMFMKYFIKAINFCTPIR